MAKKTIRRRVRRAPRCVPSGDMCKGGGFYGLGFIGAAYYYITTATGFWMGVWGFLKAIVWPAFLIYEVLKMTGA